MAIPDGGGIPVVVGVTSASRNDSTLVEPTLDRRHIGPLPKRIIGDKAYYSDPLDQHLQAQGIEMIAPTGANATRFRMEDRSAAIGTVGRSNGCSHG